MKVREMAIVLRRVIPCALAFLIPLAHCAVAETELYDFPDNAPRAADFEVSVGGQSVFVYDTQVAAVATFGIEGETVVRVQRSESFKECVVRPLSANICARVNGRIVEFTLSKPMHLSVEFDGDIKRPLFIFTNPPETPPPASKNVKHFAAGKIHRVGQINLSSDQTLYIAGGAIVQAYVHAMDASGIRILGPGILDASNRRKKKITSIRLERCRDVEIRDTLIIDSYGWTVHVRGCKGVAIVNMKQVGWRANSDGIDIDASSDVHVSGTFLRNADDCVAIKNISRGDGRGIVTENILVEDSVFWNSLPGNAIEVGFELRGEAVRNVVFQDCDIIRVEQGAVFSIHNGDTAAVEDVTFEDIRAEDVRGDFADLYIGLSIYSDDCPNPYRRTDPRRKILPAKMRDPISGDNASQWLLPTDKHRYAANRGSIRNVTFRNIQFFASELPPSIMIGYDDQHAIENVTFDGIYLNGRRISSWPADKLTTRHAKNIRFVEIRQ